MLFKLRSFRLLFIAFSLSIHPLTHSDDFHFNTFNNHGSIGLINSPSARFYNEGSFGLTIYKGTPDQKITITASPYDWLEASFFYTNIQNERYCLDESIDFCKQDYKDKGFNFKLRLKEEGIFPALAIGSYDIAGTGKYSSEYIVGSYGFNKVDINFGLGWGALNGTKEFKNPFIYLHDSLANRSVNDLGSGGKKKKNRYFSDKEVSNFYGLSYAISNKLIFKIEHDTMLAPYSDDEITPIKYDFPKSRATFGFEYLHKNNFIIGLSGERGNYISLKFAYRGNSASSLQNEYKYKSASNNKNLNKYGKLIENLDRNGIGVNKIYENASSIGIEITQFTFPNLDLIEEIIYIATKDSGITKDVKKEYVIGDLEVYSDFDNDYIKNSKLIYERDRLQAFNTSTKFNIRPFLAAREGFFKVAALVENNSEYIFLDNFFFSSNIQYSIKDNFGDLYLPPNDTFPEQVRSDIKKYLRRMEGRPVIGRAQFDYHLTPKKNHHIMLTAGLLEEMFSGYGIEYLFFDNKKNYAYGFELFDVTKRDYDLRFGTLDYRTSTGHLNFYYRNYGLLPFDAKISYGKYLAGDKGLTFELSRSYKNGAKFGIFASFTDVSFNEFGEGSFDKGLFFSIPLYKDLVDYTWRPLTKDPAAKLLRKHTLHDLLVKFRPYNSTN